LLVSLTLSEFSRILDCVFTIDPLAQSLKLVMSNLPRKRNDVKHEITRAYGVEHPDGVALRASFLIDKDGIVQHETINNLPLGRNIDEMLRVIDALQYSEEYGEVCPAGWQKGDEAMKPTHDGVADYLGHHADKL